MKISATVYCLLDWITRFRNLFSLIWFSSVWFGLVQFSLVWFILVHIVSAEINQGRKLFKGGNYQFLGGFDRGNYSREESIQGRKLFAEIRYIFQYLCRERASTQGKDPTIHTYYIYVLYICTSKIIVNTYVILTYV